MMNPDLYKKILESHFKGDFVLTDDPLVISSQYPTEKGLVILLSPSFENPGPWSVIENLVSVNREMLSVLSVNYILTDNALPLMDDILTFGNYGVLIGDSSDRSVYINQNLEINQVPPLHTGSLDKQAMQLSESILTYLRSRYYELTHHRW